MKSNKAKLVKVLTGKLCDVAIKVFAKIGGHANNAVKIKKLLQMIFLVFVMVFDV